MSGDEPEPHRHQVIDVPKLAAIVEEYQLHALGCPKCGISTRAPLPPGVPAGQFGPRLQAIVSVCSGAYRMSKRGIEELVEDFFDVPISLGSVSNLEQAPSDAIAAPVDEVARVIRDEPVVHADETGWYERSKRAWLWGAVTSRMALFLIRARRGARVAKELLGAAFTGILVYEHCLCHELSLRGLSFERQRPLPLIYKGVHLECGYRLDVVVGGSLLVEVKAVERLLPVHETQALTYLRLTRLPAALIVNFNVAVLRHGLRRLSHNPNHPFSPSRLLAFM